ncbi:S-methyl-5'-thioadenosine phosphorylase [Phaeovibrio sulfidiphilus]|uniref:S-methyl-5'-thioadenosine phosphorylase n=1 Tax=Phaeovibrio sulfidiphilus TaxID=1220600 RepID=A0A8J7CP43_9PROT|nr:S-methyl-5'-thioadenosine phosphorylase [Phaeovibrio sulfidiphilus]MBE1236602.1 S-methyl-5'-thioadenosine phosphorylase [Phaeovibrio sulfidiphilus]
MADDYRKPVLGVIGGSGLYEVEGLQDARWETVESPFGEPSDQVLCGTLDGLDMVFLPRHGRGHRVPPSDINYRANIDILKRKGVTEILSVSAVGSLAENLPPGKFVIVDQFFDRTFARNKSFFGPGCVAHVSVAHPVSSWMMDRVEDALKTAAIDYHRGGTYLVMEGPQFSTVAESNIYRQWGCHVIGMTNMPEAKLAREAEIAYATVAMVTDFDSWHPEHDNVSVEMVIKVAHENAHKARALIKAMPAVMKDRPYPLPDGSHRTLDFAIMTAKDKRCPDLVAKLDAVAGRVLNR